MNRYPLKYIKHCPFCGHNELERVKYGDLSCPKCNVIFSVTHGSDRIHGTKVIGTIRNGDYEPTNRKPWRPRAVIEELTAKIVELEAEKENTRPDYGVLLDQSHRLIDQLRKDADNLKAERDSWRNLYNREVEHNESMFESDEATKQTIAEFKAAGADEVVVLVREPEPRGFIEVGTNGNGMVVLNLDKDRTGHIIFSPEQAWNLAESLAKKSKEAEKEF